MIHITKSESGITWSNWPITENGVSSIPFKVSEEDLKSVTEGTKEFDVINGEVILKDSNKKAEREEAERLAKEEKEAEELAKKTRKRELISKVALGTATEEEQDEFADLLN